MSEENKKVELNDEELEKVSGGRTQGGNFQVGDWVKSVGTSAGGAPVYYHVNAINGSYFDGTGYMRQITDNKVVCVGNSTFSKIYFQKPALVPTWLPEL